MATLSSTSKVSSASALPSVIAERYEVLGLLGVGGMGRVYRVRDRRLDEVVALKVLRRELVDAPGMLERFRSEVKLARRVTSSHVVRTFDLGEHAGDHFLTMEYLDGQSLAQLLDGSRLPLAEILRIARATCGGIAAAHTAGVLHRDLKPDNILIGHDGRLAITDFGIAHATADPRRTGEGFVGTPAYMAPEQLDAEATVGPPVDFYAFGAILFEMIAERRPFLGSDPFKVALARLTKAPPDPRIYREIPDALAELVVSCLARDPKDRPPNATAIGVRLAAVDPNESPASRPTLPVMSRPIVPAQHTRAIAFLPLHATGALVELADGLSEEIVDALTMTRALRIRPITASRAAARPDRDVREIGRELDVDVVVEGSMRQRGPLVRISARAIGVSDGFQLWANHFDTAPEGLLSVGDEVARAVGRALTVEIDLPPRGAPSADAVALYLESKAKLRALWFADVGAIIPDLEQALALAPDDAAILSTLATAVARSAFFASGTELTRARTLAERAIALAPTSGEAWFALGISCLYASDHATAARALRRSVTHSTGLAIAQSLLGAILLEAGGLDDAIAHLEAAGQIDPGGSHYTDLPRAYIYRDNDYAAAFAVLSSARVHGGMLGFATARLRLWQGKLTAMAPFESEYPEEVRRNLEAIRHVYETGEFTAGAREELDALLRSLSVRRRASNSQFLCELLVHVGELDAAMTYVELAVDAGLQDRMWFERCPLLAPLRSRPRFGELAAVVSARADAVLSAIRDEATP